MAMGPPRSASATWTAKNVRVSVAEAVYGRKLQILTSTSRTVTPPGILAVVYRVLAEMIGLIVRDGASCRSGGTPKLQLQLTASGNFRVGGKSWQSLGAFRALALTDKQ